MDIRRSRAQVGMTVIELLVAITLLGVVSTLVLVGVQNSLRTLTLADDQNRGLQDAKVILDRLSRDIRQARGVVCDAAVPTTGAAVVDAQGLPTRCPDHLQLWVDDDSDYLLDASEVITWQLAPNADNVHFDVWRCKGALTLGDACDGNAVGVQRKLQASALIVRTLFNYEDVRGAPVQPEDATLVRLRLDYDAIVGRGVDEKQATVSARLRNKG